MDMEQGGLHIGGKLRHARLLKGLSLKEVAGAVGVSESFISKLEHEKVLPSLAVLHRLVAFLGINVTSLFNGGDEGAGPLFVMRADARPTITTHMPRAVDGVILERLIPLTPHALLQANIHEIVPGGGSQGEISHAGEEMGYVLEGVLDLVVGGQSSRLFRGDSFFFASEEPHGYSNPGSETARVLWVNTPPTF